MLVAIAFIVFGILRERVGMNDQRSVWQNMHVGIYRLVYQNHTHDHDQHTDRDLFP